RTAHRARSPPPPLWRARGPDPAPRRAKSARPARAPRPPSILVVGWEVGTMRATKPAQRAGHVGFVDQVQLDPSTSGEAAMRPHTRLAERAALIVVGQADPEIVLFARQRKAREQSLAVEIPPAPEHRRNPHAFPRAERTVELPGGAGATTREGAPGRATFAETAKASRRRHGGAVFYMGAPTWPPYQRCSGRPGGAVAPLD